MRISHLFALALAAAALSGCSRGGPKDGPLNAVGETPVRYVICAAGDTSCFVAARFNDLDSCNKHKDISGMICGRGDNSGTVTCRPDTGVLGAVAYCTK